MISSLLIASLAWAALAADVSAASDDSSALLSDRAASNKLPWSYGFVAGSIKWSSDQTIMRLGGHVDGDVEFVFQGDGNLVIKQGGIVKWDWANICGECSGGVDDLDCHDGKCTLEFQNDGNLVAYENKHGRNDTFFRTGTGPIHDEFVAKAYSLFFRNQKPWIEIFSLDNYLLWSTLDVYYSFSLLRNQGDEAEDAVGFGPLNPTWLSKKEPFARLNLDIRFFLREDGNIVVSQRGVEEENIQWQSGTTGHNCGTGYCFLQFMSNGNLAAFDASNGTAVKYWATGTAARPGYHGAGARLFFTNRSPYIVVYTEDLRVMWETVESSGYTYHYTDRTGFWPVYGTDPLNWRTVKGRPNNHTDLNQICINTTACETCLGMCHATSHAGLPDPDEQPEVWPDPPNGLLIDSMFSGSQADTHWGTVMNCVGKKKCFNDRGQQVQPDGYPIDWFWGYMNAPADQDNDS